MRALFTCIVTAVMVLSPLPAGHATSVSGKTIKGAHGETLTVSKIKVTDKGTIRVSGRNFDETVGIYLGLCLVPKKGELPSPCGGGINKDGISQASMWISSNPPPYGSGLAKPYLPGGRFTYSFKLSKMIGTVNCAKVRCAITVRADHLRSDDRSYDMLIPITFN